MRHAEADLYWSQADDDAQDARDAAMFDAMPYTGDHIHSCRSNYGSDFEVRTADDQAEMEIMVDSYGTRGEGPAWRLMRATICDENGTEREATDEELARMAVEHADAINEGAGDFVESVR